MAATCLTHDPIARLRPKRRLSLRDLFVVIAVAAVVAAVWRWELRSFTCFYTPVAALAGSIFLYGWWTKRWGFPLLLICLLVTSAHAITIVSTRRVTTNEGRASSNLRQIAIALNLYENQQGSFPPAYIADANGKPMHSWRVLILPYLEEPALFKQYNFAEPWDSPNNLKVAQRMPAVFRYVRDPTGTQTTPYVVIVDDESLFPGDVGVKLAEVTDGTHATLAVVEWPESDVVWTEPRDLDLSRLHVLTHPPASAVTGKHRHSGGSMHVSLADGHVQRLSLHKAPASRYLREIITRAGGEAIEEAGK